jgi:flagellar biosynthesis/type III secretory pathway chaperone
MNPDVAQLVQILEQETVVARALVETLQADQRRIIDQDVAALEQSNRDKEAVVLRFETLEQARRELTNRVAARLGVPPDQARVSTFCERLGAQGASLQEAAENLRAVIGSLKELVDVGRGFLEQSILGIRGLLSLIQSLRTPGPQTYDATGRFAASESSPPVSVRREV